MPSILDKIREDSGYQRPQMSTQEREVNSDLRTSQESTSTTEEAQSTWERGLYVEITMVGQGAERDSSEVTSLRKESRWVPYAKKYMNMKTHGLKTTASMGRQEQGSMGSLVCPSWPADWEGSQVGIQVDPKDDLPEPTSAACTLTVAKPFINSSRYAVFMLQTGNHCTKKRTLR